MTKICRATLRGIVATVWDGFGPTTFEAVCFATDCSQVDISGTVQRSFERWM